MPKGKLVLKWEQDCSKHLKGKTIKTVRYLNDEELEQFGWDRRSLVIFFTDGSYITPSADDEGNDAGALFTSFEGLEVIPVI